MLLLVYVLTRELRGDFLDDDLQSNNNTAMHVGPLMLKAAATTPLDNNL